MSRQDQSRFIAAAPALLITAAALVGCASGPTSADRPWIPPTPELKNSTQTQAEIDNDTIDYSDLGFRLMMDDFSRILHTNRPTRLSPLSLPY